MFKHGEVYDFGYQKSVGDDINVYPYCLTKYIKVIPNISLMLQSSESIISLPVNESTLTRILDNERLYNTFYNSNNRVIPIRVALAMSMFDFDILRDLDDYAFTQEQECMYDETCEILNQVCIEIAEGTGMTGPMESDQLRNFVKSIEFLLETKSKDEIPMVMEAVKNIEDHVIGYMNAFEGKFKRELCDIQLHFCTLYHEETVHEMRKLKHITSMTADYDVYSLKTQFGSMMEINNMEAFMKGAH